MPSRKIVAIATLSAFCMVWYYYWIATAGTFKKQRKETAVFYELQSDAILKGQTNFPVQPPAGLSSLPDPYDPSANATYRLTNVDYDGNPYFMHDATYFNNKLYSYFGVAPAFLIYIPARTIVGKYPSAESVCSFFCGVGVLFLILLFFGLTENFGVRNNFLTISILIGLGLGTGIPCMVSRSAAYEVSIAAAFALTSISFWLFYLWQRTSQDKILVYLGITLGLLISTRPSLFILFFVFAFFIAKKNGRLLIPLTVPVVILGIPAALFNYVRFGNFFEFGSRYQLQGGHPQDFLCTNHGLKAYFECLRFSSTTYLFQPLKYLKTFPYVSLHPERFLSLSPKVPYNFDQMGGLVFFAPVVLVGALCAFKATRSRRMLYPYILSVIAILITLGLINGCTQRYLIDFAGIAYLITAVFLMEVSTHSRFAEIAEFLAGIFTVYSVAAGFLLGVYSHQNFQNYNPALYDYISKMLTF